MLCMKSHCLHCCLQDPYDPLERHRTPPPAPMHPGYELSPMGPFSPISSPGSPSTQPDDQKASAAKEAMRRRQQAWQQRSRTSDSGQAAQLDSTPLDASQPGPAAAWGHAQSLAEQSYGPPPPPPPPDAPAPPAPHGQHPYGWQQAAVSPMKPSPPWANGGLAPEALLPWQQHAEEREQERQQQQRLAEEMEQVRQHIEVRTSPDCLSEIDSAAQSQGTLFVFATGRVSAAMAGIAGSSTQVGWDHGFMVLTLTCNHEGWL